MLGLIALGQVVPGVFIAMGQPLPGMAAVPYLIVSTVVHWGYYYMLNVAYRHGDLSVVYPVARGLAPLLIALGAQIWVGEQLPWQAWAGIACISGAMLLLSRGSRTAATGATGLAAAIATSVIVAVYSIADGVGVRLAGNALSYIGWLFAAEIFVAGYILGTRYERLRALPARVILLGIAGGFLSGLAYALVLYAKTLAPLGIVSALRETSVIFAAMIGVVWFGERPRRLRLFAASIVAAGIVAIAMSR